MRFLKFIKLQRRKRKSFLSMSFKISLNMKILMFFYIFLLTFLIFHATIKEKRKVKSMKLSKYAEKIGVKRATATKWFHKGLYNG